MKPLDVEPIDGGHPKNPRPVVAEPDDHELGADPEIPELVAAEPVDQELEAADPEDRELAGLKSGLGK